MKYLTNSGLSYFLNKIKIYIASQLNSKASVIHTHTSSDITDLPSGLMVDSALSSSSENAVQNKVVKNALDGKSDTGHTHITSDITNFPTLSTVATSGSYNDLSNKPTIPTVNNATLKIQKNGTDVKTFTANASTDVTCNISVPTKTSDLTNDSGYITSSGSCNYANSAGYTNWLRTSSHADHLFHTEWDGSYFWTYVTAGDGGYRAVRVERSNSSGWADSAGSVAWTNVSGRPTALSQFSNDSGFISSEIDSMGEGWVRFKCGLQICWEHGEYVDGQVISYPKVFSGYPSIVTSSAANGINWGEANFTMIVNAGRNYACWQAIGRWK